jgi:hypothetical protein
MVEWLQPRRTRPSPIKSWNTAQWSWQHQVCESVLQDSTNNPHLCTHSRCESRTGRWRTQGCPRQPNFLPIEHAIARNTAAFRRGDSRQPLARRLHLSRYQIYVQRAAEIIRESVDVDGAIFLDASIGSFAGLVDETQTQQGSMTPSSADTSLHSTKTGGSSHAHEEKHCIVLGSSVTATSKRRSSHIAPSLPLSFSERSLQKLLAKYPRGKIWSYDDEDIYEGLCDSPRTADFVNRRGERWRERKLLRTLFPGARSLALVGMWDPHRSRWFAGSILWTCSPTRILSTESELNYMTAFGQSVMSEIARIDVKMADRAKATFISSISHELR